MEDYAAFLDDDFEGAEDEEYAGLAQGDDNRGVSPQVLINTNELGTGHRTLLIATHPSASAFFRPKFLKKKPVGVILSSDVDLREESFVRTHKSSGAPIYVHDSSTVVVLCQSPVPDQESSSWVNALITEIKPERVIVFDTLNTPEAAVHHLPESAQMLQSASTKEKHFVTFLDPPFFVTNVSAAALTLGEVQGMSVQTYLIHQSIDPTLTSFLRVLKHLKSIGVIEIEFLPEELRLVATPDSTSSLYM